VPRRFAQVDVFTTEPYLGNPVAVVLGADGMADDAMQRFARWTNLSETTFVLAPESAEADYRVRIFTPGRELPFAGHPTVGTACALVMSGASAAGEVVLEEGVGPVPVEVEEQGGKFSGRFRLEQPPEVPDRAPTAADMAAILSLRPDDVIDVFCAGMGVNFTFVQVRDREAVDRSQLDLPTWSKLLADEWGPQVHVFAGELSDGGEVYARMYGPKFGIPEDPATGSAAAALAGTIGLRAGSSLNLDIRQGVKMGRPSLIRTSSSIEGGELKSIHVGGGCVFVAEGQIEVPESMLERARG